MTTPTFLQFLRGVLGVTSLTEPQRVFVRVVFDGIDPARLTGRDRDLARQLFGDVETIPPEARAVLAMLKGARVGGTWLCSLWLLYRAVTADCSGLAAGELGFCVAVAPDLRLARQCVRYALGAAQSVPSLAALIRAETSDGFVLQRPDGRSVSIEALPATRGGSALRGRTLLAALMDESSFFRDRESGVVNDSELYRALGIRCTVLGAKLLVISTAWLEAGVLHELIKTNHGKPTTALACIAPTELMREGDARIAQVVSDERSRDPENAAREFDCQTLGGGCGIFFDHSAIATALAPGLPNPLPPIAGARVGFGVDPAFRSDSFAACVVRKVQDGFEVAELFERSPKKGQPLVPSVVMAEAIAFGKRHGARELCTDGHYIESVREHARGSGFGINVCPEGQKGKALVYMKARDLLHGGSIAIPGGMTALARQLREVVSKPTPGGGISISSPRRGGMHGDLVSAFVLALWRSEQVSRGGGRRLIKVYRNGWTDDGGVGGW